jgi:hypothetical protein
MVAPASVPASDEEVAELARELGVDVGADAEGLRLLLDDELEQLDAAAAKRLAARLKGAPGALVCAGCGMAVLVRFRANRCRACGARFAGEPRQSRGLDALDARGEAPAAVEPKGPPPSPLSLAAARKLAKGVTLAADNEDWLTRAERIRKDAEAAEKQKQAAAAAKKAAAEVEAKRKADEEAQKKAAAEAEAKRKADEEAKKKAAAEAEAKRKADEEAKKKAAAEAEARAKAAAAAEAKKKADEEAKKKAAEEARKRALAAAEAKAKEDAERARKEEEERIAREAAASEARLREEEARAAKETRRPSLGAVRGPRAGQVVRCEDMPIPAVVGQSAVVWLSGEGQGRLHIPNGKAEVVNGTDRTGVVNLTLGDLVSIGEELFVFDERAELENVQAPSLHFARGDTEPGGPWAYWNEPVKVGASTKCAVRVVDDGVDDEHAGIFTRFGRVVIEDTSRPGADNGVYVANKKVPWALLVDGTVFKLGKEGPTLKAVAGAADLKPKTAKAAAMKPSRNVRTVLDIKDKKGGLFRRVVLFSRREVRFGKVGRDKTGKMLNELIIVPAPGEEADVDEKQGALTLARDGVEIRCDGKCPMELDDEPLAKGKASLLRRGFQLVVGDDLVLEGRAYRSPTGVEQQKVPQLGMNGGHPIECVRMDRLNLNHSYVFLVRMLRIGSDPTAPLRVSMPGVSDKHAQIIFVDGKFQIVAVKAGAKVKVCSPAGAAKYDTEVELEPGVPTNLAIDTDIQLGDATLHFREAQDSDFLPPD